jgi:ATP-binding cassette subfamily B protein
MASRIRLLRLLPRAGHRVAAALTVLYAVRALIPAAQAIAVGRLIAVLFAAHTDRQALLAAAPVAGLFLADQVVWLLLDPARTLLVRRIDGDLRARVRRVAAGVPGLAELESEQFQNRAARAVAPGMGLGRDRSAGAAASGSSS